MLLQGMEGGWVVIEASHTVRSGLNVTCHMLSVLYYIVSFKIHVFRMYSAIFNALVNALVNKCL